MPAHVVTTINNRLPFRRYSKPFEITLSDTITDRNLQLNGTPYRYLQNLGTSGLVMIAWEPAGDLVDIWLNQGEIIEGGHWMHIKSTGTASTEFRGFLGCEMVD